MRKILMITLLLILISHSGYCQLRMDNPKSNFAVYGEVAFSVLANSNFTLNLETKLGSSKSQNFHVYLRGGFGYLDRKLIFDDEDETAYIGQFGGVFLFGADDTYFELYVGGIIGSFEEKDSGTIPSSNTVRSKTLPSIDVGFRYQEPGSNVFIRLKAGLFGVGGGVGYSF